MKIVLITLSLLVSTVSVLAQADMSNTVIKNTEIKRNSGLRSNAYFYQPNVTKNGSIYLFREFKNTAKLYDRRNNDVYIVKNINFNIQRSMFESKVHPDSIFSFNFNNIDKIEINGKEFRSFFYEPLQRGKVFEVVGETKDFTIIRSFKIDVQQGNPNPMLARTAARYIQKEDHFVVKGDSMEEFKLKRKSVLKLLNGEKAAAAKEYAKENGLSFKKSAELQQILNHVTTK